MHFLKQRDLKTRKESNCLLQSWALNFQLKTCKMPTLQTPTEVEAGVGEEEAEGEAEGEGAEAEAKEEAEAEAGMIPLKEGAPALKRAPEGGNLSRKADTNCRPPPCHIFFLTDLSEPSSGRLPLPSPVCFPPNSPSHYPDPSFFLSLNNASGVVRLEVLTKWKP